MLNRREFLAVGSGLATAPALGSQVLASRGSQPSRSSPTTLLFWDDYYLNRRENLKRRVGQPELVPEATFEEPNFWISSGYPTVFRHESGVWRMLYNGKSSFPDEQGQYSHDRFPLLAESDDGIRWRTPDLTRRVPLPDRRFPHQVMPVDEFGQWDCYFDERAEDPNERVKGLVMLSAGERTGLWTSPDGLSWKRVAGVQWRAGENIDPPSTAFWNEVRQSYVISARPSRRLKRVVAFSETTDWRHFTDEELVLLPMPRTPHWPSFTAWLHFPMRESSSGCYGFTTPSPRVSTSTGKGQPIASWPTVTMAGIFSAPCGKRSCPIPHPASWVEEWSVRTACWWMTTTRSAFIPAPQVWSTAITSMIILDESESSDRVRGKTRAPS